MNGVPTTSTTLLRDIGSDVKNARWGEFVERYRGMMTGYLKTYFPVLEADDVVQETLVALSQVLPNYRYDPAVTGHFHNYLTGILRNKAYRECERRARAKALQDDLSVILPAQDSKREAEVAKWQESVFEIAMRELLADAEIHERSKQIFLRLTVDGVPADEVASAYGVERNIVDKIKSRMIARLKTIVAGLEGVDGD